jgi:hypothetical protein
MRTENNDVSQDTRGQGKGKRIGTVEKPDRFIPSSEWQDVPDWAVLPNGGQYRMDFASNKNQVRWDNPPGPETVIDKRKLPKSSRKRTLPTPSGEEKIDTSWFEPEIIPEEPEPAPPQIISGALYRGGKFNLSGASKTFKTFGLSDLAFSVANGLEWWGIPTIQSPVLYLDFELMRFDYQFRINEVRKARGTGDFSHIRRIGLRGKQMNQDLWDKLISLILRDKYGLVIFDPTYKLFVGRDENFAGDVATVLANFERVASETDVGVCNAHHFSKGNQAIKERGDRGSGSGVFFRDPDALFEMVPHEAGKEKGDVFTVMPTVRSFERIDDFVIRWKFPIFERDGTGLNPAELKQRKRTGPPKKGTPEQVAKLLKEQLLTKTKLVKLLQDEIGVGRARAYELVEEAEQEKTIVFDGIANTFERNSNRGK